MTTPVPGTGLAPDSYYDVTYQCNTPTCPYYQKGGEVNPCYSNAGDITKAIWCNSCSNWCEILTAVYLDPQPILT